MRVNKKKSKNTRMYTFIGTVKRNTRTLARTD